MGPGHRRRRCTPPKQSLRGYHLRGGAQHHALEVEAERMPAEYVAERRATRHCGDAVDHHQERLVQRHRSGRHPSGDVQPRPAPGERVHQQEHGEHLDDHGVRREHRDAGRRVGERGRGEGEVMTTDRYEQQVDESPSDQEESHTPTATELGDGRPQSRVHGWRRWRNACPGQAHEPDHTLV